jgi:regulator of sigma E protease
MEGLIMTAQLMLGLSILVGVHEAGHLLAAKAFGMRVEKFSIGFPPKIWGFQYGETEYSFGAIPLGGFVKITGMIDESLDTKSMSAEPEPWEFRSKPAWQRLIVMMGGIIVNVLTGIVIFVAMTYSNGESFITKEELNTHGIWANELGQEMGFMTGDRILKVNGQDFEELSDLTSAEVIFDENSYYTVQRGEEILEIAIPDGFLDKYVDKKKYSGMFIDIRRPFQVEMVQAGGLASDGGVEVGDKFVSVNDQPTTYFHEFQNVLKENREKEVKAVVERKGENKELTLLVGDNGKIGIGVDFLLNYSHRDYTFGESIGKGTSQAFGIIWNTVKGFGKIFQGEVSASNSISGPIGIAQMFGGTWNWAKFWAMTGLLSMSLAFLNFLPIPALDGGHVVFLTYEIVSGQKPSDKFLENAQKVGMVLLLGIMGFAIFNDLFKAIF